MKVLRFLTLGAVGVSLVSFYAWWMATVLSLEAWAIDSRRDPQAESRERDLFEMDPPDPKSPEYDRKVVGIYGNATTKKMKFVLPAVIRPKERPSLRVVVLAGSLELITVNFAAERAVATSLGCGVLLWAAWRLLQRRAKA